MRFLVPFLLLVSGGFLHAKAPAAPSNLTVKALGVNAFLFEWKDNADNETGFEIWLSLGKTAPRKYETVARPDAPGYLLLLPDNLEYTRQALNAQVLAYNADGKSNLTSIVSAKLPDKSTFDAPTNLKAVTIADNAIRLSWKDHSTSEQGYEIQYRKKNKGDWKFLGNIQTQASYRVTAGELELNKEYEFRVRAYKSYGAALTAFSNTASAKTTKFQNPTKLAAFPAGEGKFRFRWKDNSGTEAGYELQAKVEGGKFVTLEEFEPDVSNIAPISGFSLNASYSFRVRAFRLVKEKRRYSSFSNVVTIRSKPLARPAKFKVAQIGRTTAKLTWKDQSSLETGYAVEYRIAGTRKFEELGTTAANATSLKTDALVPGKIYQFRLRAFNESSTSKFTRPLAGETKDGIIGGPPPEIFYGTGFSHEILVSRPAKLKRSPWAPLPAGLRFHAATRKITGVPTNDNLVTSTVTAKFSDGSTDVRKLVFRITRPPAAPVATGSFSAVSVGTGNTSAVPLAGKFADPDVTIARRVTTTKGTLDIILYPKPTPKTVENFLSYADGGKYGNSFFHRSVRDFVVQGGGFTADGSTYGKVATGAPVKNEPGISNKAGTVAMAKLGGDPDSATSQWFVSVADNSANLDYQNGGFTVFGRVSSPGLALMREINDLPVADYAFPIGSSSENLEDVPVDAVSPPASPDPSTLVKILSIAPVEPLRYEAGSSNTSVATVSISGGNVRVSGVAAGSTTITVKAIDLDGEETSRTFTVTVTP